MIAAAWTGSACVAWPANCRNRFGHEVAADLFARTVPEDAVLLIKDGPQYPAFGVVNRILKQPHYMPLVVVRYPLSRFRQ